MPATSLQLREADREDGGEEEQLDDQPGQERFTACGGARELLGPGAARGRASGDLLGEVRGGQAPFANRSCSSPSRLDRLDVVGWSDDAGTGLADQVGGRRRPRHEREDRPLGGEVLEDLAGENALAAAARVGDQEQQRLGVALQLERGLAGRVGDQLELVPQPARVRPLAVGGAEVAQEASLDVEAGFVECSQERARVALAEEAARVRDPARRACSRVPRSRRSRSRSRSRRPSPWAKAARLLGDRLRDAGDRIGRAGDEPGDALVDLLLRAHRHALGAPVRVRDERVAQVGDPRRPRGHLHRRADEVDRVRRRGGEERRRFPPCGRS